MAWGRAQRVLLARALSTLPSPGPDGTAIQGLEGGTPAQVPPRGAPALWTPRDMRYTYLFSSQLLLSACEN